MELIIHNTDKDRGKLHVTENAPNLCWTFLQINPRVYYKTYFSTDPIPATGVSRESTWTRGRQGNRIISNFSPWRSGTRGFVLRMRHVSLMLGAQRHFEMEGGLGISSSFFLSLFFFFLPLLPSSCVRCVELGNIPRCSEYARIRVYRCVNLHPQNIIPPERRGFIVLT